MKSKRTKRGKGRKLYKKQSEKYSNQALSIIGTNAAGIKAKIPSLLNTIKFFKPSIITIQETKIH